MTRSKVCLASPRCVMCIQDIHVHAYVWCLENGACLRRHACSVHARDFAPPATPALCHFHMIYPPPPRPPLTRDHLLSTLHMLASNHHATPNILQTSSDRELAYGKGLGSEAGLEFGYGLDGLAAKSSLSFHSRQQSFHEEVSLLPIRIHDAATDHTLSYAPLVLSTFLGLLSITHTTPTTLATPTRSRCESQRTRERAAKRRRVDGRGWG